MPIPTKYMPGTEGKILILMLRIERGEQLWNSDDAKELDELGLIRISKFATAALNRSDRGRTLKLRDNR